MPTAACCATVNPHLPHPPPLSTPPRRYGPYFGQQPTYPSVGVGQQQLQDMMESVPRVRVRTAADRARDQLADLAVLNERLAGKGAAEAASARQAEEEEAEEKEEAASFTLCTHLGCHPSCSFHCLSLALCARRRCL